MGKYPVDRASFITGAKEARMHAGHCIESIRKSIMCQVDVGPTLIVRGASWWGSK
ncbi:hypothetical protein B0O99DRAFT_636364 [Bisporella sp. PMI_857]|nr:hypothetical protein B0O99DRAFT_636364 [Bisporella sp. PMI_857]